MRDQFYPSHRTDDPLPRRSDAVLALRAGYPWHISYIPRTDGLLLLARAMLCEPGEQAAHATFDMWCVEGGKCVNPFPPGNRTPLCRVSDDHEVEAGLSG